MEQNLLDPLIAGFYQAGAGLIGWAKALEPLRRLLKAALVQVHAIELESGNVGFSHEAGSASPQGALDFIRHYHRLDPRRHLLLDGALGHWSSCHEHFNDEFVALDPFYQEFLLPYGIRYSSGTRLYQDQQVVVLLSVHRGPDSQPLDSADLDLAHRLTRHLSEAIGIYCGHRRQSSQASVGIELLGRFQQPMVLVDETRHIHFANDAARRLLAESPILSARHEALRAWRAADDAQLLIAVRRLQLDGGMSLGAEQADDKIFLRLGGSEPVGLGVYVYALRPHGTMGAFGVRSLALVMLHDPSRQTQPDPFVVAAMWDLSPAEARVAVGLGAGRSLAEIASDHGVSRNTVRSQLQSAMDKMGVSRQAELVGNLAGMPLVSLA